MQREFIRTRRPDWNMRHAFDLAAGWRYGLVVGVGFAFAGWGWDAAQLVSAHVALGWVKFAEALLVFLPLSMIAGLLAARAYDSALIKFLIWVAWGVVAGIVATYLPFDGVRVAANLLDSTSRGIPFLAPPEQIPTLAGFCGFLGAAAALPSTFLQIWTTQLAWDRSTGEGRMSSASWLVLAPALLLAILGLLFDSLDNSSLRAPHLVMDRIVQFVLTAPPDLDTSRLPPAEVQTAATGMPWREQMTRTYTQYLAGLAFGTFDQATVDVAFDNGFVWRCQVQSGRFVSGCIDLSANYRSVVRSFLQSGQATCQDCNLRVTAEAAAWQAGHRATASPAVVNLSHHLGSLVDVYAEFGGAPAIVCRFYGDNLVVLASCQ